MTYIIINTQEQFENLFSKLVEAVIGVEAEIKYHNVVTGISRRIFKHCYTKDGDLYEQIEYITMLDKADEKNNNLLTQERNLCNMMDIVLKHLNEKFYIAEMHISVKDMEMINHYSGIYNRSFLK